MTTSKPSGRPDNGVCEKCGGITEPYSLKLFDNSEKWYAPGSKCDSCLEKERQEQHEKERVERENMYFDSCGFCPINRLMTFDTFKTNEKNKKAYEYMIGLEKVENIFITGKCGAGKTHLASSLAVKIFKKGKLLQFVNMPELLMQIRDTFKPESKKSELEIVSEYAKSYILFLDDFGAEKASEWTLETIFLILDSRIRNMLPTVITSNLSISDIEKIFNDRIASRIAGNYKIIELNDIDHRINK